MSEGEAARTSAATKKRKKKRKAKSERESVPVFAKSFPRHPLLDPLLAAFERGDYATVRRDAEKLAKSRDEDDDVRGAARELLKRIDPDPISIYLLILPFLLLVFLSGWYYLHAHAPQ